MLEEARSTSISPGLSSLNTFKSFFKVPATSTMLLTLDMEVLLEWRVFVFDTPAFKPESMKVESVFEATLIERMAERHRC